MATKLKRHTIELVKEVKAGEIETKVYTTPPFIPFSLVYEALDLIADLTTNKKNKTDKDIIETAADFVVRAYGEQFTKDELFNGLHAPQLAESLFDQVQFVAHGKENDESKKYLAKNR